MNLSGLVIGLFSFVIIGVFHPIVIKCEYHFTDKIWPLFLLLGMGLLLIAVRVDGAIASSLWSIAGFACLWSIGELKEQRERVAKGWFPANPKWKRY